MSDDIGRLVLGMREGDFFTIGDNIRITLYKVAAKTEVIIEAPKSCFIKRNNYKDEPDAKGRT